MLEPEQELERAAAEDPAAHAAAADAGYNLDSYSDCSDAGGGMPAVDGAASLRVPQRRRRRPRQSATLYTLPELAMTPRTAGYRAASERAAAELAAGRLDEAERLYHELSEAELEHVDLCMYHVAVINEQMGRFEQADSVYGMVEARPGRGQSCHRPPSVRTHQPPPRLANPPP